MFGLKETRMCSVCGEWNDEPTPDPCFSCMLDDNAGATPVLYLGDATTDDEAVESLSAFLDLLDM